MSAEQDDISLEVKVASRNQHVIIVNELVLIKSNSSTTCWNLISDLSHKSQLLKHILTFVQNYASSTNVEANAEHKDDDNDNEDELEKPKQYIEVIAFKQSSAADSVSNVPLNKPIYPLLHRHQWKSISFLIEDELAQQSQQFLSSIQHSHHNAEQTPFFKRQWKDMPSRTTEGQASQTQHAYSANGKKLGYKRFYNRSSPISTFGSLSEISSLYHIFGAILIVFLTGILTNEALEKGVLYRFDLLRWNFDKLDKVFLIWSAMFSYSFVFVMLFHQYRLRSIDRLNFGVIYFFLLLPFLYVPFRMIRYLQLPAASAAIVSCEQIRMIMKIHAYISEMYRAAHGGEIFHDLHAFVNIKMNENQNHYAWLAQDWIAAWNQCMKISQIKHFPPTERQQAGPLEYPYESGLSTPSKPYDINIDTILNEINKDSSIINTNVPIVVQIAHLPYHQHVHSFLNFLFCPSLVYRFSYPCYAQKELSNEDNSSVDEEEARYYKVNWQFVFYQSVNMMGCLLFVFVVLYRYICPSFENTPYEPFTMSTFLSSIFSAAIPGMLLVLMCFFGVIHCWLNICSEILHYTDRVFYEDWWNANTFASYSKKWNLVVYHWSYSYFYLPSLEAGYSKQTADLFTFLIWASIQEYVFTAVSGCFYPCLLTSCVIFGLLFYSVPFMDSQRAALRFQYQEEENNEAEMDANDENNGVWNVFLWIMLFLQNGFFVTLYAREWYAHQAFLQGKIVLDMDSYLPYSWQSASYPNGTAICQT